jgi:hypothetical protein
MSPEYEKPEYFDRLVLKNNATRVALKDGEIAYLPNPRRRKDTKILEMLARIDGVTESEIHKELNVEMSTATNYLNIPPYYRYSKKADGTRGGETVWQLTSFRGARLVGDEFRGSLQEINTTPNDEKTCLEEAFDKAVQEARKASKEVRRERLRNAPKKPNQRSVTTTVFERNPDVVAEVLERAKGICEHEQCRKPAPFRRASDNSPYLEVHHKIPLAQGGDDTVENAIALCPNCHRKAHFG